MPVRYSSKYVSNIDDAKKASYFGYILGKTAIPLSDFFNGSPSITVKDEKVDIVLGTPKGDYLDELDFGADITVTPSNVNSLPAMMIMETLYCTSDSKYVLMCIKDYAANNFCGAVLMYVDKDATINGTDSRSQNEPDGKTHNYTEIWNCTLKQGWNYLILEVTSTETSTTVNQTLKCTSSQKKPEGFEWTVIGEDFFN
jgi:hypothetical protein